MLDARNEQDLLRAKDYVVFMNGGPQRELLKEKILENKILRDLVISAKNIIGESAGSMVCAEYMRISRDDSASTAKGLGIIKDSIIEAHYTQRNRHQQLRKEMLEVSASYGIGIDSVTGIVIDTETYPEEYEVIGNGLVELVIEENLEKLQRMCLKKQKEMRDLLLNRFEHPSLVSAKISISGYK